VISASRPLRGLHRECRPAVQADFANASPRDHNARVAISQKTAIGASVLYLGRAVLGVVHRCNRTNTYVAPRTDDHVL